MDVLGIQTLYSLPDASGYSIDSGLGVLRVALDGGIGRYRADQLSTSFIANVQWSLNPVEFAYIQAFYRRAALKGSTPFYANLIIDTSGVQSYLCNIIPGSWKPVKQNQGLLYIVSAQLEVTPAIDTPALLAADLLLIESYSIPVSEIGIGNLYLSFKNGTLQTNSIAVTSNPLLKVPCVLQDTVTYQNFMLTADDNGFVTYAPTALANYVTAIPFSDLANNYTYVLSLQNQNLIYSARN